MNKILRSTLLMILLPLASSGADEAQGTAEIRLPRLTARPGATVVVPILVRPGDTRDPIVSANLRITYDSRVLTASSVRKEGCITAENWIEAHRVGTQDTTGFIVIALATANQTPFAEGTLLKIAFVVSDSARGRTGSPLTLTQGILNNGIPDARLINGYVSLETFSRSDLNENGRVDLDDFFLFADGFGYRGGDAKFNARYDLNQNQIVDLDDFFLFADDFGRN